MTGEPKIEIFEKNRENSRNPKLDFEKIKKNTARHALKSRILIYFYIGFLVYLGSPISGYPPLEPYEFYWFLIGLNWPF